jgi:hypothetical protein
VLRTPHHEEKLNTGIPAGPGPTFLLSDTVGCTPKKVKPKK